MCFSDYRYALPCSFVVENGLFCCASKTLIKSELGETPRPSSELPQFGREYGGTVLPCYRTLGLRGMQYASCMATKERDRGRRRELCFVVVVVVD